MDRSNLTPEALVAHDRYVRALAKALVFDPSLAEDVAQETWLAALENAPRDPRSLRAWLASIARNLAFRTWRGQDRRAHRERVAARSEAVPSANEILERETARRSLVEAVFELEEPYRSALVLRYLEDLPPREVARRLAVPVETARTRIKRGLEMLRARLDREHGSSRSAWCVALVQGFRLEPSSYIPPVSAGLKPLVVGGLVMAASKKLAAGVAVIAICLLLFFAWSRGRSGGGGEETRAPQVVLSPTAGKETPDVPAALESSEMPTRAPSASEAFEPATPTDPFGSLRVHVQWDDGRAASSILAKVLPWDDTDYDFRELQAQTGDDGSFLLEKVHEGKVIVTLDRGVIASTRVERGQETALTIRIEPGFEVEGTVENIDGVPVPGAEVWLSQINDPNFGFPVARSGADGRFKIRGVQKNVNGMWITAAAQGYALSSAGKVRAGVGAKVPIRLVLPEAGGELKGAVHAPDGTPIAGAQVRVTFQNSSGIANFDRGSRDGTEWEPSNSVVVWTDATGTFHAASLSLGEAEIYVRARGLVSSLTTTRIGSELTERVTIRLEAGASLSGTITDASGNPAAKTDVRVTAEDGLREQFTRSAVDGSYQLRGIPPGRCRVRAGPEYGVMSEKFLEFPDRGALRWDAVLPPVPAGPDGSIRGRVVDEQDRPLVGWRVIVSSDVRGSYGQVGGDWSPHTDSDGRFLIEGVAQARYFVAVSSPEPHTTLFPDATVHDVVPGPQEVLVRVTPETRPSAYVRGRIVDPQGRPVESARITLFLSRDDFLNVRGIEEASDAGTGEFRLGPYVAGRWRVKIDAFGYPTSHLGYHGLLPGQDLDLGTIRLQQGGSIVIRLRRDDGTEVGYPSLSLAVAPKWHNIQTPEIEGESVILGPLPPGSYRLVVRGEPADQNPRTARDQFAFEIRAGEKAEAELVLRSGVSTVLRIRSPDSDPLPRNGRVTYSVLDVAGKEVVRSSGRADGSGVCEQKIGCLVRGHYRIKAERQDGQRAAAEFDVGRSEVVPEVHQIEILPR